MTFLPRSHSPHTSLAQHLQAGDTRDLEWVMGQICLPVLLRLRELHVDSNFLHGHIHPENIILCDQKFARLEGGINLDTAHDNYAWEELPDDFYTAPEQRESFPLPSSDIFSLAVILIELLADLDVSQRFLDTLLELREQRFQAQLTGLPEEIIDLLVCMTDPDPEARPDVQQILNELRLLGYVPQKPRRWRIPIAATLLLASLASFYAYAPNLLYQQGCQAQKNRQYAKAQMFHQWTVRINPRHPAANYELGILYEDQQNFPKATEYYQQSADQGFSLAQNNLARLELLENKPQKAIPRLQNILQSPQPVPPILEAQVHKNFGWSHFLLGNYAEAEGHLKLAIEQNPDSASAYCIWAKMLDRQAQPKQAKPLWEKCLERVNPSFPEEDQWRQDAETQLS